MLILDNHRFSFSKFSNNEIKEVFFQIGLEIGSRNGQLREAHNAVGFINMTVFFFPFFPPLSQVLARFQKREII